MNKTQIIGAFVRTCKKMSIDPENFFDEFKSTLSEKIQLHHCINCGLKITKQLVYDEALKDYENALNSGYEYMDNFDYEHHFENGKLISKYRGKYGYAKDESKKYLYKRKCMTCRNMDNSLVKQSFAARQFFQSLMLVSSITEGNKE